MCMQCVAGAMTAGATATGLRSFIVAKRFAWLTPRRLRLVTIGLLASAVIASATLVTGSTSPQDKQGVGAQQSPGATR